MKKIILLFFVTLFISFNVFAHPYPYSLALPPLAPPPVDIPIQNIPQETDVWCWAAVAQQIIAAKKGIHITPNQCSLVAISNGAPPAHCCMNYELCKVPGSITQIQNLLLYFGGSFSGLAPPADPMTLYHTLAMGKPVIMSIKSHYSTIGHVIVIRGMGFVQTPMGIVPMLHVNDPMNRFTQAIPFNQLAPMWQAAIVVHT
ncbi:papain-like cysteine protease family protein [Acinetobacter indicus]|uniref:papain-like cysteine protease family protein n=1 Tax=Acinetobacter indicus TaxID=756892 RepID=UPI00321213F6